MWSCLSGLLFRPATVTRGLYFELIMASRRGLLRRIAVGSLLRTNFVNEIGPSSRARALLMAATCSLRSQVLHQEKLFLFTDDWNEAVGRVEWGMFRRKQGLKEAIQGLFQAVLKIFSLEGLSPRGVNRSFHSGLRPSFQSDLHRRYFRYAQIPHNIFISLKAWS